MSLGEHLTELRNRLVVCALAVLIMAIVGWIIYDWVFELLKQPFVEAKHQGLKADINFQGVGKALNVRLQMAAYLGLIMASPVVMYEVWRFITPGLHRNERRYALGFFGTAIPLFYLGCYMGYLMLNKAVPLLLGFTPKTLGVTTIINYDDYLAMLVKTILAFGIAFVVPVVLVLCNAMGLVSGRAMLKAWRWVVLLCFVFTAVMVPTPEPMTMIGMTLPLIILFFLAVIISLLNDRRRAKREAELDDEQASVIDDEVEAIEAPSALDEVDGR